MAVKCNQLIYTPLNSLTFRISGGTKILTPHKVNNTICSIEGPDDLNFSLGTTLQIKGVKYKINIIEEQINKKAVYYNLSIAKRTKSSTFIMPMLGGNRKLFFWNRLFINCFIKADAEDNCIALLYRWSSDPLFIKFEKALSKFKDFRKKYEKDYQNFMFGKYSKFSKLYKINILDFHELEVDGEVGQILFKSPKRKSMMENKLDVILDEDSELLSIMEENKETFNFETYKFKKIV